MSLKQLLTQKELIVAAGVYDAFSALLASQHDFKALYVSGAGIAYTRLGRPDIGLVSMTEVAETVALISDRVDTPLVVDADNGYGNALNVQRCVRYFERAGAQALQFEDQSMPKRCGHLQGKTIISAQEMVGKIKAAVDARQSENLLIIARTDAIAVDGYEAALERAAQYKEAGADVLFIEAPRTIEQMKGIVDRFSADIPLLANMVEGGHTPLHSAHELHEMGFKLVIFPGGIVRALAKTANDYYSSLSMHASNQPFMDHMYDFTGLNQVLGTQQLLDSANKYV